MSHERSDLVSPEKSRAVFEPSALKEHGTVETLTQGGNGNISDGAYQS
ncbi:hypothetical protein [Tistrella sp.]|nr:hypothetical protein [Tistrella sp.]|tara:strand:- start:1665 stop:1808 length:144 start_codon:yes stop_codon:yes gene_type:complete